jgi:lambda repressor-like predicted transcriptional regulator
VPGGRIGEGQRAEIIAAIERGESVSAAARQAAVHRNSASRILKVARRPQREGEVVTAELVIRDALKTDPRHELEEILAALRHSEHRLRALAEHTNHSVNRRLGPEANR